MAPLPFLSTSGPMSYLPQFDKPETRARLYIRYFSQLRNPHKWLLCSSWVLAVPHQSHIPLSFLSAHLALSPLSGCSARPGSLLFLTSLTFYSLSCPTSNTLSSKWLLCSSWVLAVPHQSHILPSSLSAHLTLSPVSGCSASAGSLLFLTSLTFYSLPCPPI